ncbi:hypothetical protein C4K26_3914 [Pseudomonas chlororaphis]|nr:hypothetical protein C4K26_3914 [Pseudomonas chlororaphis]
MPCVNGGRRADELPEVRGVAAGGGLYHTGFAHGCDDLPPEPSRVACGFFAAAPGMRGHILLGFAILFSSPVSGPPGHR